MRLLGLLTRGLGGSGLCCRKGVGVVVLAARGLEVEPDDEEPEEVEAAVSVESAGFSLMRSA